MAFESIYSGMSGLLAFSKGLDLISNNVANMNTPGYKGSDLLFRDFSYKFDLASQSSEGQNAFQRGVGVSSGSTSTRFQQGELRNTGGQTDLAIDGNGFFILREDDKTFYTRAGQFTFNNDGVLVTQDTSASVMGIDESGRLSEISILGFRTNPAKATSEVGFAGNLSTGSTEHTINDVELFDSLGERHNVTVTFTNNGSQTPRSWLVEITDSNDEVLVMEKFDSNPTVLPKSILIHLRLVLLRKIQKPQILPSISGNRVNLAGRHPFPVVPLRI